MSIKKSFRDMTCIEHSIENQIKPKAREELVKIHFESEGFKVIKLEEHYFDEETKKHLGMALQIDEIKKLQNSNKIFESINDIENRHLPDFVCEKGKKIIFVEVKSDSFNPNNKNQTFRQRETMKELQKRGYEVECWNVDIDSMFNNIHKLKKILNENKLPLFTKWNLKIKR